MNELDMTMFHQAFFDEAADLLTDLEDQLLHLCETPNDPELLNSIFRCAHSIKGGSATFGFADIAHFTHGLETMLDKVRGGEISVDTQLITLLLESRDQMRALLAVARGEASSSPDSQPLIDRIEAAMNGKLPVAQAPAAVIAEVETEAPGSGPAMHSGQLRFVPGPDIIRQANDPLLLLRQLERHCHVEEILCDPSRIPSLDQLDPEACYLAWDIRLHTDESDEEILDIFEFVADESELTLAHDEIIAEATPPELEPTVVIHAEEKHPNSMSIADQHAAVVQRSTAPPQGRSDTQTIRVATDKVDKLINLVGELVINQSMLNAVVQNFSMSKLPRLIEAVEDMERASRELQERVMAVRMLPIKHAFGRFPRLVHDLASQCGKRIELHMTGEETELDKSVIEAIADPLTHLVRNAVDHGIDTPEERAASGKPEVGRVGLNAFHEGGNIVIEVSDDGRGLNRDRIHKKALERGLIAENEPLTEDYIQNLIFHPGFSTAEQVTDVSGRGVGMDIVRQGVQSLGGSITLSSTPEIGTTFRVRLPLTMAILEGLSLSVGEEVYILPLTSIVESIRPKASDVSMVAGRGEVVQVRGEVLPILRLYQSFGSKPLITEPTKGLLVIVENDRQKVAVLVDELIGQSQVVIKSLETNYQKVDGVAGATILGDGRVALILDVPGLIRGMKGAVSAAA